MKLLFVCTGNICRSPTAEGVMQAKFEQYGIDGVVDSAGTHGYHVGEAPDSRSAAEALKNGVDISMQRSRRVEEYDFHEFDIIFALDKGHLESLNAMRPANASASVELFLSYGGVEFEDEVPDPYYGGAEGFKHVYRLIDEACDNIAKKLAA